MPRVISKSDIDFIIQDHIGNIIFEEALRKGREPEDLLIDLGHYIRFNSIFGGGVANLAGEIGLRQELFIDHSEAVRIVADRSMDVAAKIFFAAVDEFGRDKTHRAMAQNTFLESGKYFGLTGEELNQLVQINQATNDAVGEVAKGYGINMKLNTSDLFTAIGFHMGSEILADEEFNILDKYLREQHPDLVAHLEKNGAYHWVNVHTTVEADHFESAVQGANLALRYCDTTDHDWVCNQIVTGFANFANAQTGFMRSLLAD